MTGRRWTGGALPGHEFTGPFAGMSAPDRKRWAASPGFFDDLDAAWEDGRLPQTFRRTGVSRR